MMLLKRVTTAVLPVRFPFSRVFFVVVWLCVWLGLVRVELALAGACFPERTQQFIGWLVCPWLVFGGEDSSSFRGV